MCVPHSAQHFFPYICHVLALLWIPIQPRELVGDHYYNCAVAAEQISAHAMSRSQRLKKLYIGGHTPRNDPNIHSAETEGQRAFSELDYIVSFCGKAILK